MAFTPASLFMPKEGTELKLLRGSPRSDVLVPSRVEQLKTAAKTFTKAFGVMSSNRKAAALLWTVRCKSADDDMPARFEC